jgi:glycosyltransferase involved in cell wall biosynthesis
MPICTLHIDVEGGWGGSSRSLYELLKRLDRNRISPVVVHRLQGPLVDWYAEIGIATFHVPEIGSFVPRSRKVLKSLAVSFPRLLRLDRAADRIAAIARQRCCSLVHLNYEGLFLLAERLRARIALPIVGHSRAHLPSSRWGSWLVRKLARNVDHMFFISPQEESRWNELLAGAAHVPASVLWNIARLPLPRRPFANPPEIVFMGNLQRSKGADRLIEIAAELERRGAPPFVCAIYGRDRSSAAYVRELKRLREARSLAHCVDFRGHVVDVENVLARAFALVRPSHENDPWGRDVIEATSAGVPVIATGSYQGVIRPGLNGYLIEPYSAEAFADHLIRLLQNSLDWRRLSEGGQALGRELFAGTSQVEQFSRVVERLVASGSIQVAGTQIDAYGLSPQP